MVDVVGGGDDVVADIQALYKSHLGDYPLPAIPYTLYLDNKY